jgi:hypothetical protein
MVLAPDQRSRDMASRILHAHGAEFVGFYGRWAYESLPANSATTGGQAYDVNVDGSRTRIRVHDGAVTVDAFAASAVTTAIGPGLFLLSLPRDANIAAVFVLDVDSGIVYASILPATGAPRHVKGTIERVA